MLIGQKRYVRIDGTAKLTSSGMSVGEIIPAGTAVTLLDSKRDANGLAVITVSYIDANGMRRNAIVNCTDLRPFAVAIPPNSTENNEPVDDIEPTIPATPTQGEDEKVNLGSVKEYVTSKQLTDIGWIGVTDSIVSDLNRVLNKYEINTTERIRHFLSQAQHESGNGRILLEQYNGDSPEDYFSNRDNRPEFEHTSPGDGAKYRGAGYIQLTWKTTYRSFSEYVGDVKIVEEGATYVAKKYAWEAAGWFWKFYKKLNEKVDFGYTVTQVTKVVNGGYTGLEKRQANYMKTKEVIQ